jgi:hypothetical protein
MTITSWADDAEMSHVKKPLNSPRGEGVYFKITIIMQILLCDFFELLTTQKSEKK